MKRLILLVIGIAALSAVAAATPVDDMVKQGFVCEAGSRGEIVCKKDGSPSKICNAEGSCFRIVAIDAVDKKLTTGSVAGHGYSNTEY
jgi:hypothetical protein